MSAVGVHVTAELTRLLRATGDGQVWTGVDGQVYMDLPGDDYLLVTRTARELEAAGWLARPGPTVAAGKVRLWRLTDAGCEALGGGFTPDRPGRGAGA